MREQVEQVTNEVELPYKPKGWRNLNLALIDHFVNEVFHPAGSTFFGMLHPTKEAAIKRAVDPATTTGRGYSEWIGAFEVEE